MATPTLEQDVPQYRRRRYMAGRQQQETKTTKVTPINQGVPFTHYRKPKQNLGLGGPKSRPDQNPPS